VGWSSRGPVSKVVLLVKGGRAAKGRDPREWTGRATLVVAFPCALTHECFKVAFKSLTKEDLAAAGGSIVERGWGGRE
jgi:hypothetical protein